MLIVLSIVGMPLVPWLSQIIKTEIHDYSDQKSIPEFHRSNILYIFYFTFIKWISGWSPSSIEKSEGTINIVILYFFIVEMPRIILAFCNIFYLLYTTNYYESCNKISLCLRDKTHLSQSILCSSNDLSLTLLTFGAPLHGDLSNSRCLSYD